MRREFFDIFAVDYENNRNDAQAVRLSGKIISLENIKHLIIFICGYFFVTLHLNMRIEK